VGAVGVAADGFGGEGWSGRAAVEHAEAIAIRRAGDRARGGTLYVTLEPCAHHGRTPPCVDAVIEAGVARVVVGAADPNPKAAGGSERLRAAGIDVELAAGELAWCARDLNAGYFSVHERGRPWVIYKAAVTLDGRMT